MVVRHYGLRACAAMLLGAFVLAAGLGCAKKSLAEKAAEAVDFKITGKVTYTRVPMRYDANGVPLGLETDPAKFTSVPARGLKIRVFQVRRETMPDFTVQDVWNLVAQSTTSSTGEYIANIGVLKNYLTFVEVEGQMTQPTTPASVVTLSSDPDGIYSTRQVIDRTVYVIRKSIDGTSSTTNATPAAVGTADVVVNFDIGLNDPWMVVLPKWWIPYQTSFPYPETVAAGSRIPAILDSFYEFNNNIGNAVPTSTGVTEMTMHYRPGLSTRRGTFVEYRPTLLPKSYDGSTYRYMGSICGGGTIDGVAQPDDAFDAATLYALMGRNAILGQGKTNILPTGVPATSLAPDLALVEGFGDAIAATLLERPFLPAGTGADRYAAVRDIRDLSQLTPAQIGPFSAPAITALTWELALINGGIASPGTVATWPNMTAQNLTRFYSGLAPTMTSGSATISTDVVSIYTQLARLQEDKTSSDNSDLKTFFGDGVLAPLCAKFNIPWTTAAEAVKPKYTTVWGSDPDSLATPLPSFTLSMAAATRIKRYYLDEANVEQAVDYYPNNSRGEVFYAMSSWGLDRTYTFRATTVPALPAGASIEVVIDGDIANPYLFPAGTATTFPLTIKGNPSDLSTPNWHRFRVRLLSPSTLVSDTQVTIHLDKVKG